MTPYPTGKGDVSVQSLIRHTKLADAYFLKDMQTSEQQVTPMLPTARV